MGNKGSKKNPARQFSCCYVQKIDAEIEITNKLSSSHEVAKELLRLHLPRNCIALIVDLAVGKPFLSVVFREFEDNYTQFPCSQYLRIPRSSELAKYSLRPQCIRFEIELEKADEGRQLGVPGLFLWCRLFILDGDNNAIREHTLWDNPSQASVKFYHAASRKTLDELQNGRSIELRYFFFADYARVGRITLYYDFDIQVM